jgi:hypothetical protein
MMPPSHRTTSAAAKAIEAFQLVLLEVAVVRLPLADFVLKGGANMRFFFASPRRSRDIDFDYLGGRFEPFAARVDQILSSRALTELLRERGLGLADPRRSKQTQTTRRWKLSLTGTGFGTVSSKLEFSGRREGASDYELRPVDVEVARRIGARSVRLNRYGPVSMVAQKVGALRMRSQTQPRDVFDLDLLFRMHPDALAATQLPEGALEEANARALALTYQEYRSTVVDYLDGDVIDIKGTEEAWNDMVLHVTQTLDARRAELR